MVFQTKPKRDPGLTNLIITQLLPISIKSTSHVQNFQSTLVLKIMVRKSIGSPNIFPIKHDLVRSLISSITQGKSFTIVASSKQGGSD